MVSLPAVVSRLVCCLDILIQHMLGHEPFSPVMSIMTLGPIMDGLNVSFQEAD